jgi:hypothetical protein
VETARTGEPISDAICEVGEGPVGEMSWFSAEITESLLWRRKLTPRIGNLTSTSKSVHLKMRPLKESVNSFSHQPGIDEPKGPARRGSVGKVVEQ